MKPLLSSGSSIDLIKAEMNEWQDLIMDTYLKLKEDSTQRQTEPNLPMPAHRHGPSSHSSDTPSQIDSGGGRIARPTLTATSEEQPQVAINHFFGEIEIRGLVNLSYFSLYSMEGPDKYKIEVDVQNRLCKCTVILTRELMTKFTQNSKEHSNLLTILMQLL